MERIDEDTGKSMTECLRFQWKFNSAYYYCAIIIIIISAQILAGKVLLSFSLKFCHSIFVKLKQTLLLNWHCK